MNTYGLAVASVKTLAVKTLSRLQADSASAQADLESAVLAALAEGEDETLPLRQYLAQTLQWEGVNVVLPPQASDLVEAASRAGLDVGPVGLLWEFSSGQWEWVLCSKLICPQAVRLATAAAEAASKYEKKQTYSTLRPTIT